MADKLNVCSLLNSEFTIFNDLMLEFDWKLNESYIDRVVYVKSGNELDTFDIKLNSNTICVSIPLKKCNFLYSVKFNDLDSAFEYVKKHIIDLHSTSS